MSDRAPGRATPLRIALRLLKRDLAGGRLTVMLLASALAVACTVSVNLLVTRVDRALLAESSALLAADLAITSNDPPSGSYRELARARGLRTALTASMRSVVAHGDRLQLARLKAVDADYPLRGTVLTSDAIFAPPRPSAHGPPPGEAWADAKLLQLLGITPGDALTVGSLELRVSRVLVLEPDRGGDLFSIAPRVMMHHADLARTELVVPGSRVSYRTLVAGSAADVAAFRAALDPGPGHRVRDPREARPEMSAAFVQAERFLALAAFAGVMLAAIGIALAATSYGDFHEATAAVLKTLGLTRREITLVFAAELVLLAAIAAAIGDLLAVLVQQVLLAGFAPAVVAQTSALPLWPLAHGVGLALVALLGFGLPALVRLSALPVAAIVARDTLSASPPGLGPALVMLAAAAAMAPWHAGEPRIVALALGGMLASAAVLAGSAWALVLAMGRIRARTGMSWRFGLANIARRARLSVLQSSAVGLGIAVILLLGLVRNDLVRQWSDRLPPDAPNHFLINVQTDERDSLVAFLHAQGLAGTEFYPMVRGRLTAIGERRVNPDDYADPRARRLADREFNLSWADRMKPDNRIVAGAFWTGANASGELSVEQGIADTLGIALGDELTFTVAGSEVTGTVTSLRAVEWDNFQVNFFVVTTPELLVGQPATWITAFRLPPDRQPVMAELVRRYPSVTVIDVDALMRQVRSVMDRVSSALMWVFGFALAAGLVVLAAAMQASQRERVLDAVLLKTLGASSRFVRRALLVEFGLLGALAGAVASAGAIGTAWIVSDVVMELAYRPHPLVPLAGVATGVAGVVTVGLAVLGRTLRAPVAQGLQATR